MKARRFKIEFPLSGDGREGQNRLISRNRGENDPESAHSDTLSESLNLSEFNRFKTIDSRIDEINSEDSGQTSADPRIERIRRKIADGYYNSPEFIEKLADTLIKKIQLAEEGQ